MKFEFERPPEKAPEKKPEEEKLKELDIARFEKLCKVGRKERDPDMLREAVALIERARIFKESKELVTPDEWEKWMEELEEYKEKEFWGLFALLARDMKILNPKADLQINERIWGEMKENLKKWRFLPFVLAEQAGSMKILKPEEEIIGQRDWEDMEEGLKSLKEREDWGNFLLLAKDMKLLRPEEEVIDQETWEEVKESQLEKCRKRKVWSRFAPDAMALKILNPKGELGLNKKDWKEMKDELEERKENKEIPLGMVTEQAAAMKILGSKVRIVKGGGLELE